MTEYIDRDAIYTAFANACTDVLERASEIYYIAGFSYEHVIEILDNIPTVNVAPVVHCKDCEYSYDELSYLCCSHGVCVDCVVPPNFY
ncbi:MAG: hypothetical protein ACI3VM_09240, partial [Oscillospiraceae bacterium]